MLFDRFAPACLVVSMVLSLLARSAPAVTYYPTTSSQFSSALNNAKPGDKILLASGTYYGSFYTSGLTDLTIGSLNPANPAIIDATGRNEGLHLTNPTNVTVQDLIVRNANDNGINIDDGGSLTGTATGVTLRNVTVTGTSSAGNHDGIKVSGLYGFHFDRVRVETWGGSAIDMVGCHDGLIENSYFADPSNNGSTGVRSKGGTSDVVIRANRLVGASTRAITIGGSTGLQYFRPQPPGTVEADNILAEGNVVIGSEASVAYINIDGGAVVRRNFIYRPENWLIRILKENTNPGFVDTARGEFTDNVVVWRQGDIGTFVNVGSNTVPGSFVYTRNRWYNETNPGNSYPSLQAVQTNSTYGVDPGLDVDQIVPWAFGWGLWLVNAVETGNSLAVADPPSLRLATPGDGASLDFDLPCPLVGDWTFSMAPASLEMEAYSQAILIDPAAIPDSLKLMGDANVDGLVGISDLVVLADHYGQTGVGWMQGNFNGDDVVGIADLSALADHYGAGGGGTVPEPGTVLFLLTGAVALWRRRR